MNVRAFLRHASVVCVLLMPGVALCVPLAYITNELAGTLSVIDTATNAVVATVPAGGFRPVGVAVNPTGSRVYVGCVACKYVSVIDTASYAVVKQVGVGTTPTGVAVNPAGTRVYVTNFDSGDVSVIDTATNAVVATVAVGIGPFGVAVNSSGTKVYVANFYSDLVSIIDASTNAVVATAATGHAPTAIAVNPAGTRLYVTVAGTSKVDVIDTGSGAVLASVAVGKNPAGVVVNPAGTRAYVANSDSNNVSVVDTGTNAVIATFPVGLNPFGIATDAAGTRLYVSNTGSNDVSVIDATIGTLISTVPVGKFPVAFGAFIGPAIITGLNVQGLWWAAGGTEAFWGINFAHAGDQVFATWYTYDVNGKAWWLSMLAKRTTDNNYSGPIYVDTGPRFDHFAGSGVPVAVGSGTLRFTDANSGTFHYDLNVGTGGSPSAVSQTKAIARYDLGTGPQVSCTFDPAADLALAPTYQDLWWAASGTESGWGVNFAHQGKNVFLTWYTYDASGAPLWLSALTTRAAGPANVYTGPLIRTSGPRFDSYKASDVAQPIPVVGTATLTFASGNSATFHYTTNGDGGLPAGVDQTKSIVRFPFAATGGTICQ